MDKKMKTTLTWYKYILKKSTDRGQPNSATSGCNSHSYSHQNVQLWHFLLIRQYSPAHLKTNIRSFKLMVRCQEVMDYWTCTTYMDVLTSNCSSAIVVFTA